MNAATMALAHLPSSQRPTSEGVVANGGADPAVVA